MKITYLYFSYLYFANSGWNDHPQISLWQLSCIWNISRLINSQVKLTILWKFKYLFKLNTNTPTLIENKRSTIILTFTKFSLNYSNLYIFPSFYSFCDTPVVIVLFVCRLLYISDVPKTMGREANFGGSLEGQPAFTKNIWNLLAVNIFKK